MSSIRLGWHMFLRDWRGGELGLLFIALALTVASISCVGFFVDRIHHALLRDATQLLGADLVVNADQPYFPTLEAKAQELQLSVAQTVTFPSMALTAVNSLSAQHSTLVAVKAVSSGYPLRGHLTLGNGEKASEKIIKQIPAPGSVWVDETLLQQLAAKLGDKLWLGDQEFVITHIIQLEPDRGANFLSFAPRVMLRLDELAKTGLQQPGSRMTYRLLVAGQPTAVEAYRTWYLNQIQRPGQHIETLETGRPEMRFTIERVERFLMLVACIASLLAALAVGMAARRYTQRHLNACALMRCLGLQQFALIKIFMVEFSVLAIAAIGLGILIGAGTHFILVWLLLPLMGTTLPMPTFQPVWQASGTGLLLLFGFALPPLLQLYSATPLSMLRRELNVFRPLEIAGTMLAAFVFGIFLLWQTDSFEFGWKVVASFLFSALLLWGMSRFVFFVLRAGVRLSARYFSGALRQAFITLNRRAAGAQLQLLALTVGLLAILLLTVIRADLFQSWQNAIAPDAPNRFLLNVQPDQRKAVEDFFAQQNLIAPRLYPMVRGRLTAINNQPVTRTNYDDSRAQRLVEREFNLSYMDKLPSYNQIHTGQWKSEKNEISIESGLAKTLNLKLGDNLRFEVAGQAIEARIGSLRKLNWDSMQVNFFIIFPTHLLEAMPQTYITAFHLPEANKNFTAQLIKRFPNLTLLDTGHIIREIQAVLDQAFLALQFLFIFTLINGLLVIYVSLISSQEERQYEAALLRVLGASNHYLKKVQRIELILLGILAGILAIIVANGVGWYLAENVFQLAFHVNIWGIALVILLGVAGTLFAGWAGLRAVLRYSPMQILGG